ncbi:MAG: hypothetical protein ACPGVU_10970 [Limisphaerales bacterium]
MPKRPNQLIIAALLIMACGVAHAAEWYEKLRPGIARKEILRVAGKPTSILGNTNRYDLKQGHLRLIYQGESMLECDHMDPGDGVSLSLYYTSEPVLTPQHLQARKAFLTQTNFTKLPKFGGPFVNTALHPGNCYVLEDGYLIVEPIVTMMGGFGYFADKTSRLTRINSKGNRQILYRAFDHWPSLKPPGLSWATIRTRSLQARFLGERVPLKKLPGGPDGRMGSGLDVRLYYLKEGLLVALTKGVLVGEPNSGIVIYWGISRPGID